MPVGSRFGPPTNATSERACKLCAGCCSLVAADLPMLALATARDALVDLGLEGRSSVICADGRRLPLGDGLFDAVCHADVLC